MRLTYPVDALVSYFYFQRDEAMAPVTKPGFLRLVGDSGAFSAYTQGKPVQLNAYAAWCKRWAGSLAWVAALDVIGNPDATYRNWATFRDDYGINAVPTLHAGGDLKWLAAYAEQGVDFIGLGGLVGLPPSRVFPWVVHVFRHARDHHPGMRFHLWGVTNRKILNAVPAYSADSSGIMGAAYRFARIDLFDPFKQAVRPVYLDGKQPYRERDILAGYYGVDPALIATSHPGNKPILVKLSSASTQAYAAWLQARHKVTAPQWVLGGEPTGTRVHIVDSAAMKLLLG